jgi:hypothetical protein
VIFSANLGTAVLGLSALQAEVLIGPVELRVDDLKTPLGIDDPAPRFSWQLDDPAPGARQTAYEVMGCVTGTLASRYHKTVQTRLPLQATTERR